MDRGHTSPRGRFSLGLRQGTYRSHYSVKAPGPAGRFYFGPPRADGPREDGSLICQADSTRFRVPPPPSEAQIAAAPASATEDGKAVKTRVKIKRITTVDYGTYGPYWRVVGVVRSSEHACERRREYRLRIIDRRSNAGAAGYEAQYTSLQGEFWVELPQGEEDRITYRVMAPRSFPPQGRGRSHICKRDGSRRFTLSTP